MLHLLSILLTIVAANVEKIMIINPQNDLATSDADLQLTLPREASQTLNFDLKPNETIKILSISVINPELSSYEVRVCWPAIYPIEFRFEQSRQGLQLVAQHTGKRVVDSIGDSAPSDKIQFKIVAEKLIFNVLPISSLIIIGYILTIVLVGVTVILPTFEFLLLG